MRVYMAITTPIDTRIPTTTPIDTRIYSYYYLYKATAIGLRLRIGTIAMNEGYGHEWGLWIISPLGRIIVRAKFKKLLKI